MIGLAMVVGVSAARADDIGPEDEARIRECTIERQSSAGAQCVTCTRSVGQPQQCTGALDGKDLRCGYGATHHTEIWCRGPRPGSTSRGMSCAIGAGPAGAGVLGALAMLSMRRRRRG